MPMLNVIKSELDIIKWVGLLMEGLWVVFVWLADIDAYTPVK